jgi:hypothetical protein
MKYIEKESKYPFHAPCTASDFLHHLPSSLQESSASSPVRGEPARKSSSQFLSGEVLGNYLERVGRQRDCRTDGLLEALQLPITPLTWRYKTSEIYSQLKQRVTTKDHKRRRQITTETPVLTHPPECRLLIADPENFALVWQSRSCLADCSQLAKNLVYEFEWWLAIVICTPMIIALRTATAFPFLSLEFWFHI